MDIVDRTVDVSEVFYRDTGKRAKHLYVGADEMGELCAIGGMHMPFTNKDGTRTFLGLVVHGITSRNHLRVS